MGIRYFKRVHLSPYVSLNFSRSGVSTTFGPHGLHFTIGPRGTSESIGLPGSGLYHTERRASSGGLGIIFKVFALAIVLIVALLVGRIIGGS